MISRLKLILIVRLFLQEKMSTETPQTKMARVESMKGAPRMAPMPIASPPSPPVIKIAMSGMMVSGSAVPTAARTLPTAPSPRFSFRPNHSMPLTNNSQPARITAKATMRRKKDIVGILAEGKRSGHAEQIQAGQI